MLTDVFISTHMQVQAILKLLPPLKPHPSHHTPPPSISVTNLTDCTLHTSDFLSTPLTHSTPHNPHTHSTPHAYSSITNSPISQSPLASISTCSECLGVCVHPSHKRGITKYSNTNHLSSKEGGSKSKLQARSYPLIPSAEQLKTVHFASMNSLTTREGGRSVATSDLKARSQPNPLLNGDERKNNLPQNESDHRNKTQPVTHQLALMSLKDLPKQPPLSLGFSRSPLDSISSVPTPPLYSSISSGYQDSPTPGDQREQDSRELRESGSELSTSLDQEGYPISASANGDILGVSAVSPDFFSASNAAMGERVRSDDDDNMSLPSHFSCSSEECPTSDDNSGDDECQIETENDSVSTKDKSNKEGVNVARKTSQLPFSQVQHSDERESGILISFGPKGRTGIGLQPPPSTQDLHVSSVFSSTQYGPIVSAAQSTTLSYKGSAESDSTISTSCAEVEQEQRLVQSIVLE